MNTNGRFAALFATLTVYLAGTAALLGEEVTLKCTADNSICCESSETKFNMGAQESIKAKGVENFLLFDFDTAPIKGRGVEKATLFLKAAMPNPMLRKAGVSTVSCPWAEGARTTEETAKEGESSFLSPETGKRTWAGPGTDFTYASFGNGGTFWRRVFLDPPKDGWYEVPVDPRIAESMAQGLSFGLSISDDNREVMHIAREVCPNTCFGNNYFCSREARANGPRLVVTLKGETDKTPPGAAKDLKMESWPVASNFEKGAVRATWTASGEYGERGSALGYKVRISCNGRAAEDLPRWRIPVPPKAGDAVTMVLDELEPGADVSLEIAALDASGNMSPCVKVAGKASPARARPEALKVPGVHIGKGAEPVVRDGKLRAWTFGDCLKVNPVTGNLLEEKGVAYSGPSGGAYRAANAVWNGATGAISLRGARGEWVAFQVAVEAADPADPKLAGIDVKLTDLTGPGDAKGRLDLKGVLVSRAWYVKGKDAWYPDPLVPLSGKFDMPWAENGVPSQKNEVVYIEFFVPKEAAPGGYAGAVTISADGVKEFRLPVSLDVLPFTIPDEIHFVWSMLSYGSAARPWGPPQAPKYMTAERDFYVVAQAHRTCLSCLHYSHNGKTYDDGAPPIEGKGAAAHVADWSKFDARFGPLFDGSAFAGTPRAGIPIDHFLLPFFENWPASMAEGYKWNVEKFEDHWKVCGLVEDGFSQEYQETWKAVLADYAKHFREKGWDRTRLQVFFNNKYDAKVYNEKTKKRGVGSSFWLLDEPHGADDFRALGFFGRMIREALGGRSNTIVFRCDVSRPQWARDCLDGVVDVHISGNYMGYRRKMDERREKFGETIWTYGGLCDLEASALELEARTLRLYGQTVDGFVPWQTVSGVESWKDRDETATTAFYPGKVVGIDGCVPSLKLKACRRGEQDLEYLWLVAQKRGLDRKQAGALIEGGLNLSSTVQRLDDQGTTFERFEGLTYEAFEALRRAAAAELAGAK
jgi:hypothetical protein